MPLLNMFHLPAVEVSLNHFLPTPHFAAAGPRPSFSPSFSENSILREHHFPSTGVGNAHTPYFGSDKAYAWGEPYHLVPETESILGSQSVQADISKVAYTDFSKKEVAPSIVSSNPELLPTLQTTKSPETGFKQPTSGLSGIPTPLLPIEESAPKALDRSPPVLDIPESLNPDLKPISTHQSPNDDGVARPSIVPSDPVNTKVSTRSSSSIQETGLEKPDYSQSAPGAPPNELQQLEGKDMELHRPTKRTSMNPPPIPEMPNVKESISWTNDHVLVKAGRASLGAIGGIIQAPFRMVQRAGQSIYYLARGDKQKALNYLRYAAAAPIAEPIRGAYNLYNWDKVIRGEKPYSRNILQDHETNWREGNKRMEYFKNIDYWYWVAEMMKKGGLKPKDLLSREGLRFLARVKPLKKRRHNLKDLILTNAGLDVGIF